MGALALSLLVFPGTGHLMLGRYKRGLIWAAVFAAVMVGFLGLAGTQATKLMEGAMSTTGDLNFDTSQLLLCVVLGLSNFGVWGLCGADTFYLSRQVPAAPTEPGVTPEPPPPGP